MLHKELIETLRLFWGANEEPARRNPPAGPPRRKSHTTTRHAVSTLTHMLYTLEAKREKYLSGDAVRVVHTFVVMRIRKAPVSTNQLNIEHASSSPLNELRPMCFIHTSAGHTYYGKTRKDYWHTELAHISRLCARNRSIVCGNRPSSSFQKNNPTNTLHFPCSTPHCVYGMHQTNRFAFCYRGWCTSEDTMPMQLGRIVLEIVWKTKKISNTINNVSSSWG